jgi:hypothetical protein
MQLLAILSSAVLAVSGSPASAPPSTATPAQACTGLTDAERNMSLFVRAEDVDAVKPLREQRYRVSRSSALPIVRGAIISVRQAPGLSVAALQRIADCHVAEATARQEPWMNNCPAFVPGAAASVRFEDGRFVVVIRSTDDAVAAEILRRAQQIPVAARTARLDSVPVTSTL